MLKDFKTFVLRGNVVDLAVGVVIGAAFAGVVAAFVEGLLSPLIGLVGGKNFDTVGWCARGECALGDGVFFAFGRVLTALVSFLLTAAAVFFLVVQPVNALMRRRKTEPDVESPTKDCPECLSSIPAGARRCAFCTSAVG